MQRPPPGADAQRSITSQLRLLFPVLVCVPLILAAAATLHTDAGQRLDPEPAAIANWAGVIGIALGAISFAVAIGAKPRTWKTILSATLCSPFAAILCWLLSSVLIEKLRDAADFHGRKTEHQEDFEISMASMTHYKKTHYTIFLKDHLVMVDIDRNDYLSAFGQVDHINPTGFCIHATVQTSGTASRILAKVGTPLPAGSLKRCTQGIPS